MKDLHLDHLGNHNQVLVVARLDPFYLTFASFSTEDDMRLFAC